MCYPGIVKQYLHRWGLLSEGGCLPCILLPWHLELLCRRCSSSKGFWDGGLVRLLLPLCFLLLKVTVRSKERQKKNPAHCESYLEHVNHVTVEIIPSTPCGAGREKKQQRKTWIGEHDKQCHSFLFLCTTLSKSTVIVKVFVLVKVTVCGQWTDWKEIWPWTLRLTGPFSK